MSCVHYKFSSKLDYNTVTFDGLHITLSELKRQIMSRERLKATDCDLQITNAQTREEYTDDEVHIPKHSSVIVRRTPIGGVKPAGRTFIVDRSDTSVVGSSRPTDSSPSMSLAQLTKTANLVDANASEVDKIKAMISQSNHDYDPIHYSKKAIGPPPANYTCYRCGKTGHYIRQCPMLLIQDKSVEGPKPVRTSKGIPQSFMVKAEPGTKGAMLTSTGEYAIPAIDAEAYAQGKKERPPFVPHDQSSSEDDSDPIPDELLCPICNDLMTDAVVIPCCGNSYCDECIRTTLLDSEEHICYTCKQSDVSPDNLIANKFLRQAVNNFKNETGYAKHGRKLVHPSVPPPPRLHLSRPLQSRQQDPLMANISQPPAVFSGTPIVTPAPQVQAPPVLPVPAALTATSTTTSTPTPTPPPSPPLPHTDVAEEGQDASPAPAPNVDHDSPRVSTGQGEPPPPEEIDPVIVMPSSSKPSDRDRQSYHMKFEPPPSSRPHHHLPSQHSRPPQPHRGGRHWERSYRNRGDPPSTHHQTIPPPLPAPPIYVAPSLYPPPPQPYPPLYPSGPGLLPPPTMGYQPQPMYPPGPPGVNPPWGPPGGQPPLFPLPPSLNLNPPPLSKEDFYKQRHHRQENITSKLDEFTKDFHKELMKYRNTSKRQRPSYSRSRSYSRSPFSRSYSRSRSRSRSRSYSYTPSRSRSRSRSHGRPYPRSPYSRRNGRTYARSRSRSNSRPRSYGYRRSGSPRTPPASFRGGGWEGPEGPAPFRSRSRSRSPGAFRNRSPGIRKPPPRELPPSELKGLSPNSHERWERDRYRQWEREYREWYNKYYKDYESQHQAMHHRGRGSRERERERDRVSPLHREYSPQGRGRRGRDEKPAPSHNPPSSSTGTKTSTKVLKTKKVKKKRAGEDSEQSQQSMDRGDATPVRDEPMDEILSPSKMAQVSSKPPSATATSKAPASKISTASVKTAVKSTSKTDKPKKEKAQKVKPKVKAEASKAKSDKVRKKTESAVTKKKDPPPAAKTSKTTKARPEDGHNTTAPKKEKVKSSSMRPTLQKTTQLFSQGALLPHPSLHESFRPGNDNRGRRDLQHGGGLLPLPHQGLSYLHQPPSPLDNRRRLGEEGRSLLGSPPGKLRRLDGLGIAVDVFSHPHAAHQPPQQRLSHPSDRPGLLPLNVGREMIWADKDRGLIRPLMELPFKPVSQRSIPLNRDPGKRGNPETSSSGAEKTTNNLDADRPSSSSESDVKKEPSASSDRGISRDKAGEKFSVTDKDTDRNSGVDRERDSTSKGDRDRDRASGSDRGRGEKASRSDRDQEKSTDRGRERASGFDRDREKVSGADRDRERTSGLDRDKTSTSDRDRDKGSDRDREKTLGSDRDRDKGSDRDREKISGSDRDREKTSGADRDREKTSGSDRDREKTSGSDRDREKTSSSDRNRTVGSDKERDRVSGSASQKVSVSAGKEAEASDKSHKIERKNSGGSGSGRSVCLDKMTIGEKSAISKKQERPSSSSKEREATEKVPKSDRTVSKERAEKSMSSLKKPDTAPKGKEGEATTVRTKLKISRKVLSSLSANSARLTQDTKHVGEIEEKSDSPANPEQPPPSTENNHDPSPKNVVQTGPLGEELLIQAPPRSKWEREDDEEEEAVTQEEDAGVPKEPSPVPQKSQAKEGQMEAPKAVKSEAHEVTRDEKKGLAKEEKKRAPKEDGKGSKLASTSVKPTKVKIIREDRKGGKTERSSAIKEDGRGRAGREDVKGGAGKDERTASTKEERSRSSKDEKNGGREENRGPETKRQRLGSDLTRETDEAAFIPDYSEGEEGSDSDEDGSTPPSASQHSNSAERENHSDSASVSTGAAADKKQKKKHKKHKKQKKHKKHKVQEKEGEHKKHKSKHKKKKHKKSKDKVAEEAKVDKAPDEDEAAPC
ncbi:E3 ubiquitin-protein ligase RBBP6-like [Entelurus aequoreus]|uniref:E3 ubiquitin-protein ligase RBBP6-like n=1 Tax=Entelurus aequoreus TaxID=161455 RepID=UPI002B1E0D0A|nr:E3 ubiquitin-protein ligase RBBP6-like [Entelurus aequoreus]